MTTPKTVRILSLDGGGMWGIISTQFMKSFCDEPLQKSLQVNFNKYQKKD